MKCWNAKRTGVSILKTNINGVLRETKTGKDWNSIYRIPRSPVACRFRTLTLSPSPRFVDTSRRGAGIPGAAEPLGVTGHFTRERTLLLYCREVVTSFECCVLFDHLFFGVLRRVVDCVPPYGVCYQYHHWRQNKYCDKHTPFLKSTQEVWEMFSLFFSRTCKRLQFLYL